MTKNEITMNKKKPMRVVRHVMRNIGDTFWTV